MKTFLTLVSVLAGVWAGPVWAQSASAGAAASTKMVQQDMSAEATRAMQIARLQELQVQLAERYYQLTNVLPAQILGLIPVNMEMRCCFSGTGSRITDSSVQGISFKEACEGMRKENYSNNPVPYADELDVDLVRDCKDEGVTIAPDRPKKKKFGLFGGKK